MQLGNIIEFELYESLVAAAQAFPATELLLEADVSAPRWGFKYLNYGVDPRPEVLVLGDHTNHKKNRLLGGINLNYLSNNQIIDLRKSLPKIMTGRDLRQRYRIGRQVLPAIFNNYYRTYNDQFIRQVTPSRLHQWYDSAKKDANAQRRQEIKDKQRSWYARDDETGRAAWDARRRLYRPGSARRERPERYPDGEKDARYRAQRAKLKELERLADINRAKIDAENERKRQYELMNQPVEDDPLAIPDDTTQANIDDLNAANILSGKKVPSTNIPTADEQDVEDLEQELETTKAEIEPEEEASTPIETDLEDEEDELPKESKLLDPELDVIFGDTITYYSPRLKKYVVERI